MQRVKERARLDDVVREHVTLRTAGVGSFKGLCPFHDEKTPSFTIRPALGTWHCFGCGEGGDVISFVQKIDHLTFVEAVERLAGQVGVELRYEEGGGGREYSPGRRTRLVEAHRLAEEFYTRTLLASPDARAGRDFLRERHFDSAAARQFGVGYAPRGGDDLARLLLAKGFTEEEALTAGLVRRGRGLYDAFRGRLMWPIRDITGDPVGFGARRLFEDDRLPAKYLNTSETPIYRKSSVLYGLDLAKKSIARERVAVIVEGYTDVMACHLSGVEGAVATCGTAFGADHVKLLRRILRDEAGGTPARAVFTFDGDAAGQAAAMKAFDGDQRWASQSFVAVAQAGQDPCELRLSSGPAGVRALIEDAVPMFEFAVRTVLARHDLGTAEGRVHAMRAAAPVIAKIRDQALRPEYTRLVAGWIGIDIEQVASEVARVGRADRRGGGSSGSSLQAARRARRDHAGNGGHGNGGQESGGQESGGVGIGHGEGDVPTADPYPPLDPRDPVVDLGMQVVQVLLQHPLLVPEEDVAAIDPSSFTSPSLRAIFDAVRALGRDAAVGASAAGWVGQVARSVPEPVEPLVTQLSVAPLRLSVDPATGDPEVRQVGRLLLEISEIGQRQAIADSLSALQRLQASDPDAAQELHVALTRRQAELAALRERYS